MKNNEKAMKKKKTKIRERGKEAVKVYWFSMFPVKKSMFSGKMPPGGSLGLQRYAAQICEAQRFFLNCCATLVRKKGFFDGMSKCQLQF